MVTKERSNNDHRRKMFSLLLLSFVTISFCQILLPMEYSALNPYQFDTQRRTWAIKMQLCSAQIYVGCQFKATINTPFTDWSLADGTYSNYSVFGVSDGCTKPLCSNTPNGTDPFSCTFAYSAGHGSTLFAQGVTGLSAGFQATFNMRITCPPGHVFKTNVVEPPVDKKLLAACPVADTSKRYVTLSTPDRVLTSPKTTDAKKYAVYVCEDTTVFAQMRFNLQAADSVSATATYFCPSGPCSTNNSPTGWFDDSGTATNFVSISNLKAQLLYFNVYGWGKHNAFNSYVFSIDVINQ